MLTISINSNGLQQIKEALELHCADPAAQNINAWAEEAVESYYNGNGVAFEIGGQYTASGRPETVVLTPDGYDLEEVEE